MSVHPETHPDANALAAFAEGRLEGEALRGLSEHLDGCRECLEIVGATVEMEREAAPPARVLSIRNRWVPLAAAAALVVAAAVASWYAWQQWRPDPAEPLLAALSALPDRPVEARISGAVHAPYVVMRSEGREAGPERLRLEAAAGRVLESAADRGDAAHQHAAGVAALLSGDPDRAVQHLERAGSLDGSKSRYWSDLAAARYEAARSTGDAQALALALAAADRALEVDGGDPAALFNRALILEALGRTAEAREAWARVPPVEEGTRWADEAARRGKALEGASK